MNKNFFWFTIFTLYFSVSSNGSQLHRNNLPSANPSRIDFCQNYKFLLRDKVIFTLATAVIVSGCCWMYKNRKKKQIQQESNHSDAIDSDEQRPHKKASNLQPQSALKCFQPIDDEVLKKILPQLFYQKDWHRLSFDGNSFFICNTWEQYRLWKLYPAFVWDDETQIENSPLIIYDQDREDKGRYFPGVTSLVNKNEKGAPVLIGSFFKGEEHTQKHRLDPYFLFATFSGAPNETVLFVQKWFVHIVYKKLNENRTRFMDIRESNKPLDGEYYFIAFAHAFHEMQQLIWTKRTPGYVRCQVAFIRPNQLYLSNVGPTIIDIPVISDSQPAEHFHAHNYTCHPQILLINTNCFTPPLTIHFLTSEGTPKKAIKIDINKIRPLLAEPLTNN